MTSATPRTAQPKTILVTGASSGIGEATARLLAAQGHRLVIGARRTERLAALAEEIQAAGGTVLYRALDVTSVDDMRTFVAFARDAFGQIDVLVNNAGVMSLSALSAGNVEEWNQMIDVNIRGVLHGIAAVLPVMEAQGFGQVVNVSSIGAFSVAPMATVYCATKYAVRAISDGLRQETDKIRVTSISPGVVESELADHMSDEKGREAARQIRRIAMQPEAIASAVLYAVEQPKEVDVNELTVRPTASFY